MRERRCKIPRRMRSFKASREEWAVIAAKAGLYANGNVSEWIRQAAMDHMVPKPDSTSKVDKPTPS